MAIGKARALPATTFLKFLTLGKLGTLAITVVFFNINVQAQGLWTSGQGNNDTVKTARFVYVNNSLRATGNATIEGRARIDSILSCWEAFIDNILSVGSNLSVGGNLTVGDSGTVAGNFSIAQGLDVTGQTQVATLLVNQNSILGIADAFKLTADSIVADALSVGGNLSVSGNSQLSKLTADSINTNYLSSTGLLNSINIVTGSINSGQYLLNGLPLTGSQWISAGSNIYFQGGNVGIGTTIPSFPLEVHGNAAVTGTVFADRIAVQSHISIGQFRFINGATQPGQADTIRTPAALQVQSTGTMQLTTAEALKMRAAGTVEITSVSDTIKLAAGTVVVVGPEPGPVPPPPPPLSSVALDVVGDVRASGSMTANSLDVSSASFDSLQVQEVLNINKKLKVGSNSLILESYPGGLLNSIYTNTNDGGGLLLQSKPGNSFNTIINANNIGKVGIGTASPQTRLHIKSNGTNDPYCGTTMRLEYQMPSPSVNGCSSGSSVWDLTTTGLDKKLTFRNPLKTVMTLTDAGNVGIGTTTPRTQLEIKNPANGAGPLLLSTPSPDIYFETGPTHYNWRVAVQEDVDAGFTISSGQQDNNAVDDSYNTRFTIKQNGNVDVCGIIRSKEWIVDPDGWCDFALAPGYKKMHWKEKKRIYTEQGYMPYMDTGKEIETSGLKVAKNFKGLMLNQEEDRLDITEIFERLEKLEERLNEMEKKMEEKDALIERLLKKRGRK